MSNDDIKFSIDELEALITGQREFLNKERKRNKSDWDKGFERGAEAILKNIELLIKCKRGN